MKYDIVFTKSALKEMLKLPGLEVRRIIEKIDLLSIEPRPPGALKLKGTQDEYWRIRIGQYRVIYEIEDLIKVVEIIAVGNRKDIY